jgi:hypothetical protein
LPTGVAAKTPLTQTIRVPLAQAPERLRRQWHVGAPTAAGAAPEPLTARRASLVTYRDRWLIGDHHAAVPPPATPTALWHHQSIAANRGACSVRSGSQAPTLTATMGAEVETA